MLTAATLSMRLRPGAPPPADVATTSAPATCAWPSAAATSRRSRRRLYLCSCDLRRSTSADVAGIRLAADLRLAIYAADSGAPPPAAGNVRQDLRLAIYAAATSGAPLPPGRRYNVQPDLPAIYAAATGAPPPGRRYNVRFSDLRPPSMRLRPPALHLTPTSLQRHARASGSAPDHSSPRVLRLRTAAARRPPRVLGDRQHGTDREVHRHQRQEQGRGPVNRTWAKAPC